MKLHIECLQEKLDMVSKEKDQIQIEHEESTSLHKITVEKLHKIVKTLEEELIEKVDKIKNQEGKIGEMKIETN